MDRTTSIYLTHHLDGEVVETLSTKGMKTADEVMDFIDNWKNSVTKESTNRLKIDVYNRILRKDDKTFLIDFGDYAYFLRVEDSPNLMP